MGTARETGPEDSALSPKIACILGEGRGDIEKVYFEQGRLQLGLEGCFHLRESERRKEKGNPPTGKGLPVGVLECVCGMNEEIALAGEQAYGGDAVGRLGGGWRAPLGGLAEEAHLWV